MRPKTALLLPLSLLLAFISLVVACASPSPGGGPQPPGSATIKPGAGPQVPLSPSLLTAAAPTPSKAGLSATMAGTPGKSTIPVTMLQPVPAATAEAGLVSFNKDILPLFKQQCALCHIDQSMGGLSLKDYDSLMRGGQSGSPLVKGNPEASLLIWKLRGGPGVVGERMPTGGPYLQDILILKVADWVRQGAANN